MHEQAALLVVPIPQTLFCHLLRAVGHAQLKTTFFIGIIDLVVPIISLVFLFVHVVVVLVPLLLLEFRLALLFELLRFVVEALLFHLEELLSLVELWMSYCELVLVERLLLTLQFRLTKERFCFFNALNCFCHVDA